MHAFLPKQNQSEERVFRNVAKSSEMLSAASRHPIPVQSLPRIVEPQQQRACACGGGCLGCKTPQLRRKHEHLQDKHLDASNASPVASTPDVNEVTHEAQGHASNAAIGPRLGTLIERSRPSGRLPVAARSEFSGIPAHTLENIRIHDDSAAHEAARGLEARAFTVGSSIYFGRGEYQPGTSAGFRVLAHEAAHAHQQANASLQSTDRLVVSSPTSREEIDADRFADALSTGGLIAPPLQMPTGNVARVMRKEDLSFTATRTTPTPKHIQETLHETDDHSGLSFGLGSGGNLFSWKSAVTVQGTPDTDSEWRAGMIQLLKDYWFYILWDDGSTCGGSFPLEKIKDSSQGIDEIRGGQQELPWFNPNKKSEIFTADGQQHQFEMLDSPGGTIPYRNRRGHFDFGATFVTYISAYNNGPNVGQQSDRYKHLLRVYWQTMLAGDFDASERNGPRYWKTDGGLTEVLGVYSGVRDDYPPKVDGITVWDKIILPIQECLAPRFKAPKITPLPKPYGVK